MADPVLMVFDEEGHAHSACLHWEGFPSILLGVLSVCRCRVRMTIPQHTLNPAWLGIETEVVGHRLIDSCEAAAMKALTTFCEQHPLEVIFAPAGLFPAVSESDPLWLVMRTR
jgi:hypothetical protein